MPATAPTAVTNIGNIELRQIFRKLMSTNRVKVPSELLAGDKTPAAWVASRPREELEALIDAHGATEAALAMAGNPRADIALLSTTVGQWITDTKEPQVQVAANGNADAAAIAMAAMVAPHLKLKVNVDEAAVRAMVKQAVQAAMNGAEPRVLEVHSPAGVMKTEEARHIKLERLILYVAQRQHIFLVGPAGTGKSHAAHQVATLLGLNFYSISVGLQSTQTDLFGYMNAHGTYVRTQFRDAYEYGGVFCLDEMDGGSANVLNALNSALANGSVAFPDGRIQRHPNFVVVATGNTWGSGKTMDYVGRAVLDGAFLSRFARMFWPVDEQLEMRLGPVPSWTKYVQNVRKLFETKNIKAIIAPRISLAGGQMILAGQSVQETIDDYIRGGLTKESLDLLDTISSREVLFG